MKKKKLNILLFINSLGCGGAENQLINTALFLDKAQFNVFVVYYNDFVHYKEIFFHQEIKVKLIKMILTIIIFVGIIILIFEAVFHITLPSGILSIF